MSVLTTHITLNIIANATLGGHKSCLCRQPQDYKTRVFLLTFCFCPVRKTFYLLSCYNHSLNFHYEFVILESIDKAKVYSYSGHRQSREWSLSLNFVAVSGRWGQRHKLTQPFVMLWGGGGALPRVTRVIVWCLSGTVPRLYSSRVSVAILNWQHRYCGDSQVHCVFIGDLRLERSVHSFLVSSHPQAVCDNMSCHIMPSLTLMIFLPFNDVSYTFLWTLNSRSL